MTFFVVLRRTGPQWRSGTSMEEQTDWDAHAAYMDSLVDHGFVVLGGPLEDEERVVLVVRAASAEVVRETLAADPWSGSHLVVDAIDRWTVRLSALP